MLASEGLSFHPEITVAVLEKRVEVLGSLPLPTWLLHSPQAPGWDLSRDAEVGFSTFLQPEWGWDGAGFFDCLGRGWGVCALGPQRDLSQGS